MAQAGYCSECKSTVWLTAEGACPAGHGAECVSNVYEAPLPADVIAAGPPAASEVGAAAEQTKRWPTSAKVLVGILGAVVVLGAVAVAFVVLRSHTVQPGPGPTVGPLAAQGTSASPVEVPATTSVSSTTSRSAVVRSGQPGSHLHAPKFGSMEREAILNVLRVPVQKQLRQRVVFKVSWIKVEGSFAFVEAEALQPNGKWIDFSNTSYAAAAGAGGFSDGADGLLRWRDGHWQIVTCNVGATDVEWLDWAARYHAPGSIFPHVGS